MRLGLRILHGPLPLTTVIMSAADISAPAGPWAASVHAREDIGADFTIAGGADGRSSRMTVVGTAIAILGSHDALQYP